MKTYGIFDTKDKLWLGRPDQDGPNIYTDHFIACAAAAVVNHQFRTLARYRACEIPKKGPFRLKDKVDAAITAVEALQEIENEARTKQPSEASKNPTDTNDAPS